MGPREGLLRWVCGVYGHLKTRASRLCDDVSRLSLCVYGFAAFLRVFLIFYGTWQDTHLRVKYTDVDYKVFSDGAGFLAAGRSPYQRHTYRYSPLFAFVCLVNPLLHPAAAKVVFAAADLLLCLVVERILLLPYWAGSSSPAASSNSSETHRSCSRSSGEGERGRADAPGSPRSSALLKQQRDRSCSRGAREEGGRQSRSRSSRRNGACSEKNSESDSCSGSSKSVVAAVLTGPVYVRKRKNLEQPHKLGKPAAVQQQETALQKNHQQQQGCEQQGRKKKRPPATEDAAEQGPAAAGAAVAAARRARQLRALLLPAICWTLYPLAPAVSTRGNADVLPCLLTVLMLHALRKDHLDAAAVCFGLAVHLKLFPAIYGIPVLLFLSSGSGSCDHTRETPSSKEERRSKKELLMLPLPHVERRSGAADASFWPAAAAVASPARGLRQRQQRQQQQQASRRDELGAALSCTRSLVRLLLSSLVLLLRLLLFPFLLPLQLLLLLDRRMWRFGLLSVAVFFALGVLFYSWYGWPFVYEAYIHHFVRRDIRHNFSPFFYLFYLSAQRSSLLQALAPFFTFVPQMSCCLLVGCYFALRGQIELAIFLQTVFFVALNKVSTSQYFLWWLCLLPFAVASTDMTARTCCQAGVTLLLFQLAQFLHLFFCHAVEFRGLPYYRGIFLSSLLLLLSELGIAWLFIVKATAGNQPQLFKQQREHAHALQGQPVHLQEGHAHICSGARRHPSEAAEEDAH